MAYEHVFRTDDAGETAPAPNSKPTRSRTIEFMGYTVRKEDISRSRNQLGRITSLTDIECQFIGTLTDTESAIGYFRNSRAVNWKWVAYHSVKMKNRGLVQHLSDLLAHRAPFRVESWNTLKHSKDIRWSTQMQGIVVCALLRRIRPFLYSEKTILEADCVLGNGPRADSGPHPFELSGAIRLRRGVWQWPQLSDGAKVEETSTCIK